MEIVPETNFNEMGLPANETKKNKQLTASLQTEILCNKIT